MKLEYCCKTKNEILGICYHNLLVDGIKKYVIDEGCGFEKEDIPTLIQINPEYIQNGWMGNCSSECEELNIL